MIDKITIKNVATFDATGIEICDLKKVNFIYGANGSGKTTISNLLQSPDQYVDSSITWKNGLPVSSLVYNRRFREENFGKGKMPGVFTLGKASTEEIEAIDEKKLQLEEIKKEGLQKKTTIASQSEKIAELSDRFLEQCWQSIYKKYEHTFSPIFEGYRRKEALKNKLLSEFNSNGSELKTSAELKEKMVTIFGQSPQRIEEIIFIDSTRLIEIEDNTIWKKIIIGKSDVEISKLIQKLNLNDWVNQGRQYLGDDLTICPFCQKQTIDDSFKGQLDEYFDEKFISDTNLVKKISEEYINKVTNIINFLQNIEATESQNNNSKINLELLSAYIKTFEQQFFSNKEIISSKLKEPSRSFALVSAKDQLETIKQLFLEANIQIKKHNLIVANYTNEKTDLVGCAWKFFIEDARILIENYNIEYNGLKKGIEKLKEERQSLLTKHETLKNNIEEDTSNITGIEASIIEINNTLSIYGFTNFKIVPFDDNHYCIQRDNGDNAEHSLSEGEITFITFLYFLQLLKGGLSPEGANEDKVLVVDDPISSLDSTILFVVSSLLKEVIKNVKINKGNIKQIMILTHNVYFHKEVSFIDGRAKNNNDTIFWIVRKSNNVSTIQYFANKNPIRGSYELLWDELKQTDKLSDITVQNIMRRIIEAYFKTMGKYNDESILDSFNDLQEKEVCRSLMCWLNFGSHCIPDDLYAEQQASIKNLYIYVFKKTFENMGHIDHYNMMMGVAIEENIPS